MHDLRTLCPHITAKKDHEETPVAAVQAGPLPLPTPEVGPRGEVGPDDDEDPEYEADAAVLAATFRTES
ncbi:hypothetical protein ACQPW1_26910 [Nocardia sp. CA-128927]|uniref:hypothetical protein n=1 Tax=Nocardia sp. CA-128927 TaxID=3239975 RepID=UPI003D99DFFF